MTSTPGGGVTQAAGVDRAAAIDIGWRCAAAINSDDAEALVEIADDGIVLHPTQLVGNGRPYRGHDGVRQWIADLTAAGCALTQSVTDVRQTGPDQLVVLGHVLIGENPSAHCRC